MLSNVDHSTMMLKIVLKTPSGGTLCLKGQTLHQEPGSAATVCCSMKAKTICKQAGVRQQHYVCKNSAAGAGSGSQAGLLAPATEPACSTGTNASE